MKENIDYYFQSLLKLNHKEGIIEGAMSPFLAAQAYCRYLKCKLQNLSRIWFNDETILQEYEMPGKQCLTRFDNLFLVNVFENNIKVQFFQDRRVMQLPIAIGFLTDSFEPTLTPVYQQYVKNEMFERSLNSAEIQSIMIDLCANPKNYLTEYLYSEGKIEKIKELTQKFI